LVKWNSGGLYKSMTFVSSVIYDIACKVTPTMAKKKGE
jgi:hypothetical protein